MSHQSVNSSKSVKRLLDEDDTLTIQGNEIICCACSKSFVFDIKEGTSNIKRHITSKCHDKCKTNYICQRQAVARRSMSIDNLNKCQEDFIHFLICLNLPLSIVDTQMFKDFAERHFDFPLMSSSTYRHDILKTVYNKKKEALLNIIANREFFINFDETTDSQSRKILSVMIGVCSPQGPRKCYLLATVEIQKANSDNVVQECLRLLDDFFGICWDKSLFKVLVTDQAAYTMLAGKKLKEIFKELKHVSCLCHCLHNVAEKVRDRNDQVDVIIAQLKKWLVKNKENQNKYCDITDLTLPKFPVLTRWGTWLDFINFIYLNYLKIGDFIQEMDNIKGTDFFSIYNGDKFESQLRNCKIYSFIPIKIKELESDSIDTEEQITILNFCIAKIESTDKVIFDYFKASMSKNPDLEFFKDFNYIRCKPSDKIYGFIPLTNVCVERLFSLYRLIFSERRESLSVDNIDKYLFIHHNKDI